MEGDLEFETSPESRFFLENLKRIHSTKEASLRSVSSDTFQDAVGEEPVEVEDFGRLKIFNSHSDTLDTSDGSGHELSISPRAFAEPVKWKYGLDHAAWCRKKKHENAGKKLRFVFFTDRSYFLSQKYLIGLT
jgi:hypothetical protein